MNMSDVLRRLLKLGLEEEQRRAPEQPEPKRPRGRRG
jgi:hypothetical protein